ncbi:hypothetical protein PG994_002558 [Apiospora phragmitis]|uniref:Uncharacterized protein n=1 Tax=Apiospora phragmitis TaxID=2905665 RepID=A0ABR1W5F7_9PEZI
MKTPMSILVPATNASKTLVNDLNMVPVLGSADMLRLPVIGPMLAGIQMALTARELIDGAEDAMDPLAERLGAETNANAEAVLDALGRPTEIIGVTAGERVLAGASAAGFASVNDAALSALSATQGKLLGHKIGSLMETPDHVVAKRRLTPLGRIL